MAINIAEAIARGCIERDAAAAAQRACEQAFCQRISELSGADLSDVSSMFGALSYNLHGLVQSPQGWATLAKVMLAHIDGVPAIVSVN